MEFSPLKESLPFAYDLERVIDDFILMALFVGNDFLPHLPGIHINEGALALMFELYKATLPQMTGYMNDGGIVAMERVELMLRGLATKEREIFEEEMGDFVDSAARPQKNGGRKGSNNNHNNSKNLGMSDPWSISCNQSRASFFVRTRIPCPAPSLSPPPTQSSPLGKRKSSSSSRPSSRIATTPTYISRQNFPPKIVRSSFDWPRIWDCIVPPLSTMEVVTFVCAIDNPSWSPPPRRPTTALSCRRRQKKKTPSMMMMMNKKNPRKTRNPSWLDSASCANTIPPK